MSFDLILPFLRPIESLLLDESISEIMGNPNGSWSSERDGRLCQEPNISFDAERLRTGLEVIANQLGKRLDEDSPRLHAQLPDGSRLAAWIPPIVSPAPAIAIRKFTSRHYTINDLITRGTLTQPIADLLAEHIRAGKTLLISGGTGTGKTTLLRILANSIPEHERILVIEDTPELHIRKPNIVAARSQTDTLKSTVTFDELLKDTLRFRPDRIILGEVRGVEARTLLDSLNTGHAGSLATIHANSAEKALRRFANLAMRSHSQSTFSDTEAEIGEAVDFVIHVERHPGRRILREVLAIRGYDRDAKRFLIERVFEMQHAAQSSSADSASIQTKETKYATA
jgi:pilus assembly protein CpaF